MRTTLTIDDSLMAELREVAHREGVPLKQLVNRVLRIGLQAMHTPERRRRYRCTTYSMGEPRVALDKALQLAASLEDDELARKVELRK